MPEEEDLFEEKNDESVEEEGGASLSEETQESTVEEESAEGEEQDEFGGDDDEPDKEIEESDTTLQENDGEEEEDAGGEEERSEGDQEEDADEEVAPLQEPQAGMGEGEKPFTIAQLASAKSEKKVQAKRLGTLRIKGRDADDKGAALGGPEGQLAIDVYETPSEIVLKSTIAGVKPEDLDIGIEDSTVNIRGSRHQEDQVKGDNYFYQECYWGTFSRSVILPVEIDSENVKASLKDGILTIRLPKIIRQKEKKIKVLAD